MKTEPENGFGESEQERIEEKRWRSSKVRRQRWGCRRKIGIKKATEVRSHGGEEVALPDPSLIATAGASRSKMHGSQANDRRPGTVTLRRREGNTICIGDIPSSNMQL
ncbi:hypothetical protein Nepgr_018640 [Nepenthes gracilis]|uniref:Uncharacterized protein n=1 Tax=Nepenthes gracilis TaxID=150966 RepID=A0AAD3XU79_NEPGR|nr:hypothetical protein Nepgr_018640 [Nepenthes gracilis]